MLRLQRLKLKLPPTLHEVQAEVFTEDEANVYTEVQAEVATGQVKDNEKAVLAITEENEVYEILSS